MNVSVMTEALGLIGIQAETAEAASSTGSRGGFH
jgi:hypothetical protein